ncbi:MAG: exonuclease SbcCD subunit D C-terminal domain-containing protein [Planctomycetes bacterium]|nr:exonuclease SbcCD subunit D C-terminal domain-containing protein [Planctomycetota bacterium]
MRILHTADWHLGHSLHSIPREFEHRRFLDWLADEVCAREVDALVVCGDVFDTIHPAASVVAMFYRFLADLRARCPGLDVVVIGGNHDSAARLEVAAPLLEAFGVRIVGGVTRAADGTLETERLLVPLRDAHGEVAAWCAAVPFLRIADLRVGGGDADNDPLIAGVEAIYAEVFDRLRASSEAGQATIALGHAYMVGGELSELSERRVLGGNQHALPVSLFPADLGYVALGHLHKAQRVGGRDRVRYSGSPIPLSMGEIDYKHQVVVADFDGAECTGIETVPVPRFVEFVRVPRQGRADLESVRVQLEALPERGDEPEEERPFLEVRVTLSQPEPNLRHVVERALEGRAPRLVRLSVELTGHGRSLADQNDPDQDLSELAPEAVFRSCYERAFETEPSAEVLREFDELLEAVRSEEPT